VAKSLKDMESGNKTGYHHMAGRLGNYWETLAA